jgi:hypothetical protein
MVEQVCSVQALKDKELSSENEGHQNVTGRGQPSVSSKAQLFEKITSKFSLIGKTGRSVMAGKTDFGATAGSFGTNLGLAMAVYI